MGEPEPKFCRLRNVNPPEPFSSRSTALPPTTQRPLVRSLSFSFLAETHTRVGITCFMYTVGALLGFFGLSGVCFWGGEIPTQCKIGKKETLPKFETTRPPRNLKIGPFGDAPSGLFSVPPTYRKNGNFGFPRFCFVHAGNFPPQESRRAPVFFYPEKGSPPADPFQIRYSNPPRWGPWKKRKTISMLLQAICFDSQSPT